MKKVLLVSNKVFHYRVSNYNYFAKRFKDYEWEFIVRSNELEKQNPFPLEFDFKEMPFSFFNYKREIEQIRPDVVIFFLHLKDIIIWPLIHWLKLKRIPVVYWNKGINLEVHNPGLRNLFFYYIHTLSDALILYSKNEVKDIWTKNQHKVFIANNTINFESFPEILQTKEEIKQEFGIPFNKVVLFVGRMRSVKKVEHLIQVFNSLDEPGLGCVIVGNSMAYNIHDLIKRDNILYLGEIHDPNNLQISKLFKASDIFCIPGDVGLGLNQAFYWGLPVVTEDGLQPPEIHYLTNGQNGFIVPENDIEKLKAKIILLLCNDELRDQFSQKARNVIINAASIETMFKGFLNCVLALSSPDRH
ncbi:MAG: glycosyltransferase family 4 protein [Proteobacteria bacterium]|nr:glycosyltransferase family 4 protein [Pseudomonadota bacterium]